MTAHRQQCLNDVGACEHIGATDTRRAGFERSGKSAVRALAARQEFHRVARYATGAVEGENRHRLAGDVIVTRHEWLILEFTGRCPQGS